MASRTLYKIISFYVTFYHRTPPGAKRVQFKTFLFFIVTYKKEKFSKIFTSPEATVTYNAFLFLP